MDKGAQASKAGDGGLHVVAERNICPRMTPGTSMRVWIPAFAFAFEERALPPPQSALASPIQFVPCLHRPPSPPAPIWALPAAARLFSQLGLAGLEARCLLGCRLLASRLLLRLLRPDTRRLLRQPLLLLRRLLLPPLLRLLALCAEPARAFALVSSRSRTRAPAACGSCRVAQAGAGGRVRAQVDAQSSSTHALQIPGRNLLRRRCRGSCGAQGRGKQHGERRRQGGQRRATAGSAVTHAEQQERGKG